MQDLAAQLKTATSELALLARLVDRLRPLSGESDRVAEQRLQQLTAQLQQNRELAAALLHYLLAVLGTRRLVRLFADTGILRTTGFWSELWRRLIYKVLPPLRNPIHFDDCLADIFSKRTDYRWLTAIGIEHWNNFFAVLFAARTVQVDSTDAVIGTLRSDMLQALEQLSLRVAALGQDAELLRAYPAADNRESPLLQQQRLFLQVIAAPTPTHLNALTHQLGLGLTVLDAIRRQVHIAGVSIELTLLLQRLQQSIDRMLLLLDLLQDSTPSKQVEACTTLLRQLVRADNLKYSLREHVAAANELRARNIVLHASHTGEHYVTESGREYWRMFRAAAIAGFIIAIMALFKLKIGGWHLPPLLEAIAFSLNYGFGFILIHLVHGTIATKQPAMTAALLADHAGRFASNGALQSEQNKLLASLFASVTRTQLVAVLGNILLAMPIALLICLLWQTVTGAPTVSPEKARHLLHDLHPLQSLALFHAAIAGVYLFLSGIISGSFDNRALYNRIPERIREHPVLNRWFGRARTDRFARYIDQNLGALAGNFFFGCLLGMTGTIGALLGLPVDIRHITFAAANLVYGADGLHYALLWREWLMCVIGVLAVGFINISVSFSCALTVALRAQGIRDVRWLALGRSVWQLFRHAPGQFFLPPRGD